MASCGIRSVLIAFLILDILVIVSTVGVWGWKLNSYKQNLDDCGSRTSLKCRQLGGLIALYTLMIIIMSVVNLIGWLLVCCCDNCCCVLAFLILTLIALVSSIILIAIYHSYGNPYGKHDQGHLNANIIIGSITMAMNLSLLILGSILIFNECDGH